MLKNVQQYTLLDWAQVRAIVDSTNASPINVQVTAHWFVTWDQVSIVWHATNTSANWFWTATRIDANNITLDGSTWNGVGWATWAASPTAKLVDAWDFTNSVFTIATDWWGDAAMTVKLAGSNGATITTDTPPDFAAAQSVTNLYDFVQSIDRESWSSIDWDTWFSVATADNYVSYVANIDSVKWLTVIPTAWTAWEVSIRVTLFNNA